MRKDTLLNRIGERRISRTSGIGMKIVGYRNVHDIDIIFDDGVVVEHKEYSSFKSGSISHPNHSYSVGRSSNIKAREQYVGKTVKNKLGFNVTCIEYIDRTKLIAQFDNGVKVTLNAQNFSLGNIGTPVDAYVGLKFTANFGMKVKICGAERISGITYFKCQFEDGTFADKPYRMRALKSGTIKHPCVDCRGVVKPFKFNDILITGIAYKYNGEVNYFVTMPNGVKDIKTFSEMREFSY